MQNQTRKVLSQTMSTAMKGGLVSTPQRGVSLLINDQFLDEDQKMIQAMAYDFAKTELEPYAAEWDKTKHFPKDTYRKAAEQGNEKAKE